MYRIDDNTLVTIVIACFAIIVLASIASHVARYSSRTRRLRDLKPVLELLAQSAPGAIPGVIAAALDGDTYTDQGVNG